jgi:hypothetical protein
LLGSVVIREVARGVVGIGRGAVGRAAAVATVAGGGIADLAQPGVLVLARIARLGRVLGYQAVGVASVGGREDRSLTLGVGDRGQIVGRVVEIGRNLGLRRAGASVSFEWKATEIARQVANGTVKLGGATPPEQRKWPRFAEGLGGTGRQKASANTIGEWAQL